MQDSEKLPLTERSPFRPSSSDSSQNSLPRHSLSSNAEKISENLAPSVPSNLKANPLSSLQTDDKKTINRPTNCEPRSQTTKCSADCGLGSESSHSSGTLLKENSSSMGLAEDKKSDETELTETTKRSRRKRNHVAWRLSANSLKISRDHQSQAGIQAVQQSQSCLAEGSRPYIFKNFGYFAHKVNDSTRRILHSASMQNFVEFTNKLLFNRSHLQHNINYRTVELDINNSLQHIDERTGQPFCNNRIKSSIYTWKDFLPRQIIYQFSKLANMYFLIIAILQFIPSLSTTGKYTTIVPVLIFVAIAISLEGYQDRQRSMADKRENFQEATVIRKSLDRGPMELRYDSITWQDIAVGDVIRVHEDQIIPADILLLHCSEGAQCFIETAAIDGESAPKQKLLNPFIKTSICKPQDLLNIKAKVVLDHPNANLDKLIGKIETKENTAPLSVDDFLFRGSILRHTTEIYGLVVYTGDESKSRMNAIDYTHIKVSKSQRHLNRTVALIASVVILMAIVCTLLFDKFRKTQEVYSWYINGQHEKHVRIFFTNIILYNTMVPLSLYVCMEIIKLSQSFFIRNDLDIYHLSTDSPARCQTTSVNEELGQITHIFTDKTGTLTENQLVLRKISVGGYSWSHDPEKWTKSRPRGMSFFQRQLKRPENTAFNHTTIKRSRTFDHRDDFTDASSAFSLRSYGKSSAPEKEKRVSTSIRVLLDYINNNPFTKYSRRAKFFLVAIALCHTCSIDNRKRTSNSNDEENQISYISTSPDEIALVEAAKQMGLILWEKDGQNIILKLALGVNSMKPIFESYEVLQTLEFSSQRKRMSVIVRMPNNKIVLFCKGADNVIIERIANQHLATRKYQAVKNRVEVRKSLENERSVMLQNTSAKTVLNFARPSMSGYKRPLVEDLENWLHDRRETVKAKDLDISTGMMERHSLALGEMLHYGNVSMDGEEQDLEKFISKDEAVYERSFQDIQSFAQEGLRVLLYGYRFIEASEYDKWSEEYNKSRLSMENRLEKVSAAAEDIEGRLDFLGVTGMEDKLQKGVIETIERLQRANIVIWMLTGDKRETASNIAFSCGLVKDYSEVITLDQSEGKLLQNIRDQIERVRSQTFGHVVTIIDGATLTAVYEQEGLQQEFMTLALYCQAVICCRSSPSQKANIVSMVQKSVHGACTLAIGDGANDVSMIRTANVGVGIIGKEGSQASRSSDFAIGQFMFLSKLLLVHGRWNYNRISKYTLGTFYKEFFFYWIQAIYQYFNGFTGTSQFENWSLSMFNTLFTSLSLLLIGIFEKDLSALTLLSVPEVYIKGQKSRAFNLRVVIGWIMLGVSQSFIVSVLVYAIYGRLSHDLQDLYPYGTLLYTIALFTINLKICYLEMHNWTIINHVVFAICIGGWFLFNVLLSLIYKETNAYLVRNRFLPEFGRYALWWLIVILMSTILIMWDIILQTMRIVLRPTDDDVLAEIQRDPSLKRVLKDEIAADFYSRAKSESFLKLRRRRVPH